MERTKTDWIEVLGRKTREHKEGLTADTWDLVEKRKELKQKINHCGDQKEKAEIQAIYSETNKKVKKSARADKKKIIHDLTDEA